MLQYVKYEEWRLSPVIGIVLLAGIIGYIMNNFWIGALSSLAAIPNLIYYIIELKKYRNQKKELNEVLDRGDISISVLELSHIASETIYAPHSSSRHRHSTKIVKFFHFTSGSSWRVPNIITHYEWSNKYYLSLTGLENISVKGNEFFFIMLQGYPDVSYIYPCKFFELDSRLKIKE